ncbi:MAG: hypothetical protein IM596_07970 [Pseudanabaena sp. M051S1SP2A07QC]|nr:hypothetical protein [Pseudanabaena sp. M051S1SP2A07QC]
MTISTYASFRNLGTKFNEVVIPPCVLPSYFYLNDKGFFTVEFEGYFYQSKDYQELVEFIKEKAVGLSIYDVIPF